MKTTLISTFIGLLFSGLLLFGSPGASSFAFYVISILTALAWIGVCLGGVKGEVAHRIRKYCVISGFGTCVQLYALIGSEHPMLAALSFVASLIIVMMAFNAKEARP